jgi:hypothetical protein
MQHWDVIHQYWIYCQALLDDGCGNLHAIEEMTQLRHVPIGRRPLRIARATNRKINQAKHQCCQKILRMSHDPASYPVVDEQLEIQPLDEDRRAEVPR